MTTRRARSIAILAMGAVLLSAAGRAQDADGGEGSSREARRTLRRAAPPLFDEAAREFGVPGDVLRAYAFVHTRWSVTQHAEREPGHMPPIFGIMGLHDGKDGWFRDQVGRAAELLGVTEEDVKEDTATNIRAAAALLRAEADRIGIRSDAVEAWAPAVEGMTAIPPGDAVDRFARKSEVYDVLATLARGYAADEISIPARPVRLDRAFSRSDLRRLHAPLVDARSLEAAPVPSVEAPSDDPIALWNPTTCFSSRSGTTVTHVTIHVMQGYYAGTISWFKNCANNVSAHYLLRSSDGQITQMVRESDMAWHVRASNPYTIGLEHEGFVNDLAWFTTAMYDASSALTRRIADRQGIDRTKTYGGTFQGPLSDLDYTIKGHVHYANQTHTDPGVLWDWARYRQLVIGGPDRDSDVLEGESTVAAALLPGETRSVTVRVKNTGALTWTAGAAFRLGTTPGNTVSWSGFACGGYMNAPADGRAYLCQSVPPGGTHDFHLDVTAPSSGTAVLAVRMVQDGVAWFGESQSWTIANACALGVPADRWKGEYWANAGLAGAPVLTRDDGASFLAFDWGSSTPSAACGVPADGFSARWTRNVTLGGGKYRFTVRSDDGVRVWIDGTLRLDKWLPQAPTTYTFYASLAAGAHDVRMEFYDNQGGAVAELSWQAVRRYR